MGQVTAAKLLRLLVPAITVGIGSALVLEIVDLIAEHWLHHLLWQDLPGWLGAGAGSRWWILLTLTATGVAVGLIVWLMPGHAGPDPATLALIHPPGPLLVVPSLLLAAILGLAGGVSLGPEFPILAANGTLAVAIGARLLPRLGTPVWAGLAAAGTLGALFGTPVGAALMLTESLAAQRSDESLWDRLFAPLAAATAGGLTALMISTGGGMSLSLPAYPGFRAIDLLTGPLIAVAAVAAGLAATWLFPRLYTLFHRLRHPLLILTAGGFCLGLLGALGGPITMFKGLEQMKELTASAHGAGALAAFTAIKLAALLVAATSGFRGGRIFPVVFVGVAFGLLVNALIPAVPVSLAVGCAVLGFVLTITRSGWLSIFLAAVLVSDPVILSIITISALPAWLLVTGRREMAAPTTATT